MSEVTVRRAKAADAPELLRLMRALAVFEGYADRFAVTEAELLARGLDAASASAPQFIAFVADNSTSGLAGMAVIVERAFTLDLRPSVLLKELYVDADSRAAGVGSALMKAVLTHVRACQASELVWDVLPDNEAAKAFYRRWGGAPVRSWARWSWQPD
jgi:ribosomal protein S18 acetylase RimI-like enzyme